MASWSPHLKRLWGSAGSDRTIPAPAEAAQPTSKTGDLLRRLKELGQSVRNDYKEPPVLSEIETRLRVCSRLFT